MNHPNGATTARAAPTEVISRAELRPAYTGLVRLAAQQFRVGPTLETAFVDGYGGDPRGPAAWYRARVREAVNTAVWAHHVGDEAFEQLPAAGLYGVVALAQA
ncbi:hypothetical protein [Kribbella sp. NPDC004875]|uniref:hypothetical protein n=1 Tax=Kribbella sp. NPDC004875 TaxID=3364107 RepID=UPI0036CEDC4F